MEFYTPDLTLLHSEWPKHDRVLDVLSAIGLNNPMMRLRFPVCFSPFLISKTEYLLNLSFCSGHYYIHVQHIFFKLLEDLIIIQFFS